MKYKASAKIVIDTRSQKKSGLYATKLQIIYQRKFKWYGIGIDVSPEDWERIEKNKGLKGNPKKIKDELDKIKIRAIEIIEDIGEFSFESFEKEFSQKKIDKKNAIEQLESYIEQLDSQERTGTASNYRDALKSFQKFKKNLSFEEITVEFLERYEKWMLNKNNSLTTVGMYVRVLRIICNYAIDKGLMKRENYPFGKNKYSIPAGRNIKKALEENEIEKLWKYEPVNESETKAKDFWFFCYLCNGMNVKDMLELKYKNVQDNKIIFARSKTFRSRKGTMKPIIVILLPEIQQIIDKYRPEKINSESYIFSILDESMSPERKKAVKNQFIKQINKWMNVIAKKLDIEKNMTSYVARHSNATMLKRKGASNEFIQENHGHADTKTTEYYLDSFEDKIKQEFAKKLLEFE